MIRVLVVDDSAFNRRTITRMLESDPSIRVAGTAVNGEEALKLAVEMQPDVITLDLEMPGMDGFSFLRVFLKRFFVPILVVSSRSESATVFKALELGAVDFIAKPTQQNSPELTLIQDLLIEKVTAIAAVKGGRVATVTGLMDEENGAVVIQPVGGPPPAPAAAPPERPRLEPPRPTAGPSTGMPLIAIGASTGGPAAVQKLLNLWDADLPAAILVAIHMPEGFTRTYANRLNEISPIMVKEAEEGDWLAPGRALIAPGGVNMTVVARGTSKSQIHLEPVRSTDRYVPSINRLFESVGTACGGRALAVVLTGMGDDGVRGAASLMAAGAEIVVESEETAVVFGMPRQVMEHGYAHRVLGLPHLLEHMRRYALGGG